MKEQVTAQNSKVLIGVTGGIAAYKALDVISSLRKKNVEVKVIMTKNAASFVSPLTFQSLSQNPVAVDMFEKIQHFEIEHISLAHWADVIAVVPATANIIGKMDLHTIFKPPKNLIAKLRQILLIYCIC